MIALPHMPRRLVHEFGWNPKAEYVQLRVPSRPATPSCLFQGLSCSNAFYTRLGSGTPAFKLAPPLLSPQFAEDCPSFETEPRTPGKREPGIPKWPKWSLRLGISGTCNWKDSRKNQKPKAGEQKAI